MIALRTSETGTPPRTKGKLSRMDLIPKLTPSSDGSSTTSSPARHDGSPAVASRSAGRNLGAFTKQHSYFSSSRRRRLEDVSILRGAALVRQNIISRLSHSNSKADPPTPKQPIDSDDWSDPWDVKREESKYAAVEQRQCENYSDMADVFSSKHSFDDKGHWASMALGRRDDDEFDQCNSQQHTSRQLTPIFDENATHKTTPPPSRHPQPLRHPLPCLFDDSDSNTSPTPLRPQQAVHRIPCLFDDNDTSESPSPPRHPPPQSSSQSEDGTHVTTMGRGKSLRLKIVTYNVQPLNEIGDDTTYDGTYDGSYDSMFEDLQFVPEQHKTLANVANMNLRSLSKAKVSEEAPIPSLPSPLSKEYLMIQHDPAFRHAQDAGYLWQSLVGYHVRFPKHWFGTLRAPPMGADAPWQYLTRHSINNNRVLNQLVRSRASAGRLLLHFIVRDLMTGVPVFDLALGCFHPNARGVRKTTRPDPKDENCRHVWMAIRKFTGAVSLMDGVLCAGRKLDETARESPLGDSRRDVTNVNMRAVFGEQPPVHTICMQESELYERLTLGVQSNPNAAKAPSLLILKEFLVLF